MQTINLPTATPAPAAAVAAAAAPAALSQMQAANKKS